MGDRLSCTKSRAIVIGALACMNGTVHVARAQTNPPRAEPARAVAATSFTGITTDTGAFAPGHQDFSRYTNPLFCVSAMSWTSSTARGTVEALKVLDTLQDVMADTIGLTQVTATARACGSHFTLENTEAKYLGALLQVALSAQNDTLAAAVTVRMAQALTPHARIQQAFDILGVLLRGDLSLGGDRKQLIPGGGYFVPSDEMSPKLQALYTPDHPFVQSLIRRIDQQGSLVERVRLQVMLREYWQVRRDTLRFFRQSEQLLAVARQLPQDMRVDTAVSVSNRSQPMWMTYHDLVRHAFYHWPDSLPVIARRAQRDLGAWQTYESVNGKVQKGKIIDFQTLSVDATIDTLWPGHARWSTTGRTVMPPLHADYWFDATSRATPRTVQPVRGQVTFIMLGRIRANAPFSARQALLVRRLLAQYGKRGLAVIVMTDAQGWLDYGGSMRALEPMTPAEEAEQIRSYYQEYEQLPITVGVQVHHYTKTSPPDGRLVQVDTLHLAPPKCDGDNAGLNGDVGVGCAQLVDRNGTVLWSGNMLWSDGEGGPDDGALFGMRSEFSDILDKALAEKRTGITPPPSSPIDRSTTSSSSSLSPSR